LGTSAKVAREVIRAGQVGNVKSIGSPFMDRGRLRAFLEDFL